MEEKDLRKFIVPVILIAMIGLSFFIIKPLFAAIVFGVLFAYMFYPLQSKLTKKVKSESASSLILVLSVLIIIVIPIFLFMPLFVRQIFELYLSLKNIDISSLLYGLISGVSGSTAMSTELLSAASHFSSNLSEIVLSLFQRTLMNLPEILFGIIIFLFTFYFALKDGSHVREYFATIFPFQKDLQEKFFEKFDQVTNSVVYGHIVVGVVQGVIAAIGYVLIGVPNALLLSVLTIVVGVLPILGPPIIWLPTALFLYIKGDVQMATSLLIFSVLTFPIDAILRPKIVSKKAEMNPAIALVGMIGGTYAFGISGFFVGPLLLAYLILLLESMRNKKSEESIVIRELKPITLTASEKGEAAL